MIKATPFTELCGFRVSVESYVAPKGPLQGNRFGHTQLNCGYAPRCLACGSSHVSGGCCTPREQRQCCGCGGNHTANCRVCIKGNEAKAALAKQAPERSRSSVATGQPAAPAQQAIPSAEQMEQGGGGTTSFKGGVSSRPPRFQLQTNVINPLLSPSRRLLSSL